MIRVSDNFKRAMKQPIKELQAYINGNITLKSEDDLISFKITCDTGMCKTAMRKLEAKYIGEHNLLGQWVHVGYGVRLTDGTFEYLDYGSFLVTEITTVKDTGVTTIIGYDKMINSMKEYTNLSVEYPIKLIDYTKILCEACNLELANNVFGKNLLDFENKDNYTYIPNRISIIDNGIRVAVTNTSQFQWTGVEFPNITDNLGKTFSISCNCNASGDNTPNIRLYWTKDGSTVTTYKALGKNGGVFTLPETMPTDINGLAIIFYANDTASETVTTDDYADFTNILLEENSTATEYSLYNKMNEWEITRELWENIEGITYRDIFVQIAQATGTTCIITNDDKIYFKHLTDTSETLTYDNMFKLKLKPVYGEINSVVLGRDPIVGEDVFLKDDDSIVTNGLTEYRISNNEIIDKNRESAINPIYNALKGISYYPFETTTEGLGWYEIGDKFNIINDSGDVFNTSLFNLSINIEGAIKETLKTEAETKTQSQYQYASTIAKRVKNTEILVNKQEQYIESLVSDVYDKNGSVNQNFTKVYQDISNIINSVQNSGGSNLIKNSVMFAYDNNNKPSDWSILTSGKNLLNLNGTRFNNNRCTITDITNGIRITNAENVQKYKYCAFLFTDFSYMLGKTYTVSSNIVCSPSTNPSRVAIYWFKDTVSIGGITTLGASGGTFTVPNTAPSEATSLAIVFYTNYGETGAIGDYVEYINIQLEEGTTSTNYESYKEGSLIIDSNAESLSAGCLSGHAFTLLDQIATQKIAVSSNVYYTFSTRIKKNTTGKCYVRLYNANEEYKIELNSGESAFYDEYELKALLPKDTYYIIEFYGSADSDAIFTDNMLAIGEYKSQWQQANGEIMNTQVNVNIDGILVKSSVYLGDYTVMSPLEFAGYSNINGTITKVFSLNKDTTLVKKLEAEDEVKMVPIKIVPVTSGDLQGWAFVPST